MKFYRTLAVAVLLLTTVLPATIIKASAETMTLACPVCHMPMTKTKTSMMTVPLMVHGSKWYCCAMCGVGKKAAAYDKMHPGKIFVAEK